MKRITLSILTVAMTAMFVAGASIAVDSTSTTTHTTAAPWFADW